MKLSKGAKSRIKMMTAAEKKAIAKAARVLAESECISMKRAETIIKWVNKHSGGY
jgi:hypothetical protein